LDALDALLRAGQEGAVSEAEALHRLSRSPRWGWGALDPVTTRLRALDVGNRPLARAQRVGHKVGQGLASGGMPRVLPAGCTE
jgi:hypothetical protein